MRQSMSLTDFDSYAAAWHELCTVTHQVAWLGSVEDMRPEGCWGASETGESGA